MSLPVTAVALTLTLTLTSCRVVSLNFQRGLFVKKAARSKHEPSTEARRIDHGQRRKLVADALLADIFQGHLKAGERLVIQDLAARYEVSPTPIREALVTLEGIGIVDIEPNCGAVVRRVTAVDVKEVCEVRRALECAAVKLACGRVDPVVLQQLADAFRQRAQMSFTSQGPSSSTPSRSILKAIEDARDADSRLHDLIAESCGNRFLAKELGRLTLLFRTLRDAAWDRRLKESDLVRFAEEAAEHLAIVEALQAGATRAATAAMAKHIQSGETYWSRDLPPS